MQISIGIYALVYVFILVVFPGFIARRFYFNGEFSKQINWNNNIISNFFYSTLVGIIITLIIIYFYSSIVNESINLDSLLNWFDNFSNFSNFHLSKNFNGFSKIFFQQYFPFIFTIYSFAAIVGYFTSRLVQLFDLDSKFKLFRFGNNWHYLFSGKILRLGSSVKNGLSSKLDVKHTFVDVLVSETGSTTVLYSGLFADYELNHLDLNKLEKLHLYRASRYKKSDGPTKLVSIPGNVFTIMGDKIINLNCTYITYEPDEAKLIKFNNKKLILKAVQYISGLIFIMALLDISFSLKIINTDWHQKLVSQGFHVKLLVVFGLNTFLGLFTPYQIKNEDLKIQFYGFKAYAALITINLILFLFITILWV